MPTKKTLIKINAKKESRVEDTWSYTDELGAVITADHDGLKIKMLMNKMNEIIEALNLVKT